jgi:dihydropyrimidinase
MVKLLEPCNITDFSIDFLSGVKEVIKTGIKSFKLFTVYKEIMVDAITLYTILKATEKYNRICMIHAENGWLLTYFEKKLKKSNKLSPTHYPESRPNFVEGEAISRVLRIAEKANAQIYIVHISTKEGVETVRKAKKNGIRVFAETCPQYLLLNDGVYKKKDGNQFIVAPPLRKREDNVALWDGIMDGTIDVIATDHCPFF